MAGGPHAAIVPCIRCLGPADRTHEGLETDRYRCRECGTDFLIDWSDGAPTEDRWPPPPDARPLLG